MKKTFRIKPGYGFCDANGQVKSAGETIELDSDVAALCARSIELVPDEPLADDGPVAAARPSLPTVA